MNAEDDILFEIDTIKDNYEKIKDNVEIIKNYDLYEIKDEICDLKNNYVTNEYLENFKDKINKLINIIPDKYETLKILLSSIIYSNEISIISDRTIHENEFERNILKLKDEFDNFEKEKEDLRNEIENLKSSNNNILKRLDKYDEKIIEMELENISNDNKSFKELQNNINDKFKTLEQNIMNILSELK